LLQIAQQLEAVNQVKEPLKSDLLNGKWELLYTTSTSILQPQVHFLFASAMYSSELLLSKFFSLKDRF